MKKIFPITLLFIITHIDCAFSSLGIQITDSILNNHFFYNSTPSKPLRVLFDYYHHSLPSTEVGNYIVTGSWTNDEGRYGWDDFVHTNTFDPVYIALEKNYQIIMSREPFSDILLSNIDIAVIINTDNPKNVSSAKLLSDVEILNLQQFVKKGGSLIIMLNAGTADREHESFEKTQLRKLVNSFGLDWNDDDTHYSDVKILEAHPFFYDVDNFHYGAGCTINVLPNAIQPQVMLNVNSDASYTDRSVHGPGIVMVKQGKGKFILIGDRGSWTGNMSRPWVDNSRFLKQLFLYSHPDQGVNQINFSLNEPLTYEVQISGLQAIPVSNSLSTVYNSYYKMFSPRATTNMPYFERSADLTLTCNKLLSGSAFSMRANIANFKWFDNPPENNNNNIDFTVSRQGKVSGISSSSYDAQWLSPDLSLLIPLLPTNGLKPGDRWNSIEPLRIPILRGSDLPPSIKHELEIVYVNDTLVDGMNCRLLRSSGEIWLDDLGVTVQDLLPNELINKVNGLDYRYYSKHGGKILFKREQWVDSKKGIVIKAKSQTRIIAWIHDLRKPIPEKNVDKDNEMIISLAHIVNYKLK